MTLYSLAPMFLPTLALADLIDAIGPLIVPAIIFLFWIIGTIASVLSKQKQRDTPADQAEKQAKLDARRRRLEEALGLPPDTLRGAGEPPELPPQTRTEQPVTRPVEQPRETVRPIAGGRVSAPKRPPAQTQTPPQVRRRQAAPITAAQTGEIGASEISDVIGTDEPRPTKRRHPVARLLRNPKTVKQIIAANAVLQRPQW